MLPTETEQSVLNEYMSLIDLLMPIIDKPEPETESFNDDADYAQ